MSGFVSKKNLLVGLMGFAVALGTITVVTPPSVAEAAPTQVTSVPFDVVFLSKSSADTFPLSATNYKEYMSSMASWWTTQAQGLLGAVAPPSQSITDTQYGAFTWTAYGQVLHVVSSNPCTSTDILSGGAADETNVYGPARLAAQSAWGVSTTAYTTDGPSARHLLIITNDAQCPTSPAGKTLGGSAFPGYGQVWSTVNVDSTGGSWSEQTGDEGTLIHEVGHSFGLYHAVGVDSCTVGLDGKVYGVTGDTADCMKAAGAGIAMVSGYGDTTNMMGDSRTFANGLSGYQKTVLGIITDGSGLTTISTPQTKQYTLAIASQDSGTQALRINDSGSNPMSEYSVDYPGLPDCTVRVLRVRPTMGTSPSTAWSQSLGSNMASFGGGVDSMLVPDPHSGSSERCLMSGDAYSSWSGDVAISVDSITGYSALVTIGLTASASSFSYVTLSATVSGGGSAAVGKTLNATGTASPVPDKWISYIWLRDGVEIPDAVGSSYTLVPADAGHNVSVQATAVRLGYAPQSATSVAVPVVITCPTTVSVSVTGDGLVGRYLTANPIGTPVNPTAWTYQWLRDGMAITGATSQSYLLTSSDGGGPKISAQATSVQGGCTAVSGASTPLANFTSVEASNISWSPASSPYYAVGTTITVQPQASPTADSWVFAWQGGNGVIANVTGSTYTIQGSDAGAAVSWQATASKAGYQSATSLSVGFQVPVPVSSISVSLTYWAAPSVGGSQDVTITSNGPWSVSVPSGVTASPASGIGITTVRLTASANSSPRSGLVTFATTDGSGASTAIAFYQGDDCGSSTSGFCYWFDLGQSINGAIETSGDRDWFRVVPNLSGTWTFTASKPSLNPLTDSYGTLYASDGTTVLATDDDGGGNLQFRVVASLTAGQTYYLEVRAYSSQVGAYTVTAMPPPAPATAILTASPTGAFTYPVQGGSLNLTITSNTVWQITGPSWVTIRVASTNSATGGMGNDVVYVEADGNSASTALTGTVTVLTTADSPPVSISIPVSQPASPPDDCGSSLASHCSLTLNATGSVSISKMVDYVGDRDWFAYTPPVAGTYTFVMSGIPTGASVCLGVDIPYTENIILNLGGSCDIAANGTLSFVGTYSADNVGQTYYLDVEDYSSSPVVSTYPYTITVTRTS